MTQAPSTSAAASAQAGPGRIGLLLLLLAAVLAIRAAVAVLHWDQLRFDDLYPLTQADQWGTGFEIWSKFGRLIPAGVFLAMRELAPEVPIVNLGFRLLALAGLCAFIAVAVLSWRIDVAWPWRVVAAGIAAAHPYWLDIVTFHINDVATALGLSFCALAVLLLRRDRLGPLALAGLAMLAMAICATYQPFVYLPLMWLLMDVAMQPQRLGAGLRRVLWAVAAVLAGMALYFLAVKLAGFSGRGSLISTPGEFLVRLNLQALSVFLHLVGPEPIVGMIAKLLGLGLLGTWLFVLVQRRRRMRAQGAADARGWPVPLFLLCLLGLCISPLHLLLVDTNSPPRLVTQLSLLYAGAALMLGAWRPGREAALPALLAVAVLGGFAWDSGRSAAMQQRLWERDVRLGRYVLAQMPPVDAPDRGPAPRVVGKVPVTYAYAGTRSYFSTLLSHFDNKSGVVTALPLLAYLGGYTDVERRYGQPDMPVTPAERTACAALFAAPPPVPSERLDAAEIAALSAVVRVGVQDGRPLVCFPAASPQPGAAEGEVEAEGAG